MRWSLVLLVLVVGCGRVAFDPLGGGVDPTGDGGHLDGRPGGDGGGGDDAPTDALASPGCGPTVIIMDDFEDGQLGGTPWTNASSAGTSAGESGGAVHFNVSAGATINATSALREVASQALDGTCLIGELAEVPSGAVTAYIRIGLPSKYIQLEVAGGIVQGRSNNGGTGGTAGGGPYDPVADRFFRIRASGSQNYTLEFGPSLSSFHAIGSLGGGFSDPSPAPIEIGVVTTGTVNQATSAAFASLYFFGP